MGGSRSVPASFGHLRASTALRRWLGGLSSFGRGGDETFWPVDLWAECVWGPQVHAPTGEADIGLGDIIEITPCRPISKTKRFTAGTVVLKRQ